MKKRFMVLVVLSMLLMAVMASSASAQQNVTYSVGVQIKNLDTANAANVTITYYDQATGASVGTLSLTGANAIPASGTKTYATLEGVSAGFNGSAVISSDRQVAAIANVFGNGFSGMGASYTALSSGGTPISIPLILRNHFGFNTWFNVQNAGAVDTTVTVTYSNGATESKAIKPGAAASFFQDANATLPDPDGSAGFVGSARISSSGNTPIVATLLQQGPTTLLGFDAFLPSQAATTPVMPLVNANNFGYITGIAIQNTGSQATDVTVSYTPSSGGANGTACTETLNIAPGASANFALNAFSATVANETCANGAKFVGAARVTTNSTNQPLVAIVNQLNSGAQKGAAYNGFNPTLATQTVELPLIMDRNFGYFTGFSIANVGTTATNITCTYTGSNVTSTGTSIAPGAALTVVTQGLIADRYAGAATCTSSAAPIVGIVNELNGTSISDAFLVYEGTNR